MMENVRLALVVQMGASDKIRIDNDGNKSHEVRGNVGVKVRSSAKKRG